MIVKEDGTIDGSFTGTDFVGYGSYLILGRICLPELNVLNNAFSSYSTTLSDKLKTSYLNHFITDIQNVFFNTNLELVLDFSWVWICNWNFIYSHVFDEMDCCYFSMVQYCCNSFYFCRFWNYFSLSRWSNSK